MIKSMFLKQHIIYKIIFLIIFILIIVSISYWPIISSNNGNNTNNNNNNNIHNNNPSKLISSDPRSCFLPKKHPIDFYGIVKKNASSLNNELEDIMKSSVKPKPGKTIFFHETSCSKNEYLQLNPRQACAIESAAKMNPDWDIFILFASPVSFNNNSDIQKISQYQQQQPFVNALLLTYPNVHIRNVNLWTYAKDTPIENWIYDGKIFQSKYLHSHISDYLRYLTLYKWGGTYLDLDVIVQKSFNEIPSNYAGAESDVFVAAGVLNFEHNGIGHEIAEMCLRDFKMNFNGNDWGNNGPGVITRVLKRVCDTTKPLLMKRERCRGFNVYEKNAFYAIEWPNWKKFFDRKHTNKTLALTEHSIVIHVWNKHSKNEKIKVGTKVAYGMIAEKYCPKVYSSCGQFF